MRNLMESSIKYIDSIPKHEKRAFLIIFISMIVVYSLFLVNFVPGCEDWYSMLEKHTLFDWEIIVGRYFPGFLNFVLFEGCFGILILG